jgi:hypothetical protein
MEHGAKKEYKKGLGSGPRMNGRYGGGEVFVDVPAGEEMGVSFLVSCIFAVWVEIFSLCSPRIRGADH